MVALVHNLSCGLILHVHLIRSYTIVLFNGPRSIYQYSNMALRLSGQNSIFGVVFFVSKSLLGIEGQKKLEKFAIFTRKPQSRARILIYRTWPIIDKFCDNFAQYPTLLCDSWIITIFALS